MRARATAAWLLVLGCSMQPATGLADSEGTARGTIVRTAPTRAPPPPATRGTGPQADAALGPILRAAIADTGCDEHPDRFDEEVFYRLHERQLSRYVKDPELRLEILTHAYCHANRVVQKYKVEKRFALKMPPEMLLAVMDVESRFDRYAVSSAGAVGLMQVMPFWPRELKAENRLFGDVDFNVRLGAEILGYYLYIERNDYVRALGRYNGSLGKRKYPDLVLGRLAQRWRGTG